MLIVSNCLASYHVTYHISLIMIPSITQCTLFLLLLLLLSLLQLLLQENEDREFALRLSDELKNPTARPPVDPSRPPPKNPRSPSVPAIPGPEGGAFQYPNAPAPAYPATTNPAYAPAYASSSAPAYASASAPAYTSASAPAYSPAYTPGPGPAPAQAYANAYSELPRAADGMRTTFPVLSQNSNSNPNFGGMSSKSNWGAEQPLNALGSMSLQPSPQDQVRGLHRSFLSFSLPFSLPCCLTTQRSRFLILVYKVCQECYYSSLPSSNTYTHMYTYMIVIL